jgi:hypothetical protein
MVKRICVLNHCFIDLNAVIYGFWMFFFTYIYVQVLHLKGDRQDFEFVKTSLAANGYDVVYDINGNYYISSIQ